MLPSSTLPNPFKRNQFKSNPIALEMKPPLLNQRLKPIKRTSMSTASQCFPQVMLKKTKKSKNCTRSSNMSEVTVNGANKVLTWSVCSASYSRVYSEAPMISDSRDAVPQTGSS